MIAEIFKWVILLSWLFLGIYVSHEEGCHLPPDMRVNKEEKINKDSTEVDERGWYYYNEREDVLYDRIQNTNSVRRKSSGD